MRLDTLPEMRTAQALYASLGFAPTARYNANPVPDVVYLELDLSEQAHQSHFPRRGKGSEEL